MTLPDFNVDKWSRDWMMSTNDRFVGLAAGDPRAWHAQIQDAYEHGLRVGIDPGA